MANKKAEIISPKDLRIEPIRDSHKNHLTGFETDNKELKDFLIDDALGNQEMGFSNTYLWFYNPENSLVAYVTILMDSIRLRGKLRQFFRDEGVEYKTLPALKVGRLCVDKRYKRRGIGTNMMYFVMEKILKLSTEVGCRFLVVDAKRESVNFYKKLGFEILKDREKGTIPMYFDMIDMLKLYREHKIILKQSTWKEKSSE